MNSRMLEMESFLMYFKQLYSSNPNLNIKADSIYYELMNYGTNDNNKDINYLFDKWINRFKYKRNIKVFWTEKQKRFLQFHNGIDYRRENNFKFFKLYVNFPKDKIYECVNKIFDYIDVNNFVTMGKVADMVRADAVVLRMKYEREARQVIEFINNDSELSQVAQMTNPFLVRCGVVGIAYDDNLSYNSVLSELMASYFRKCRRDNIYNVSLNDFRNYVISEYNINFRNDSGIYEFSKRANEGDLLRFGCVEKFILNYDQIYQIIIKALDGNTKLDEITMMVYKYCDSNNDVFMLNYFYKAIENQKKCNVNNVSKVDNINSNLTDIKNIVDRYIVYACKKYEMDGALKHLSSYLNGNIRAITRDNEFRKLFYDYVSPSLVLMIAGNNVVEYVMNTVTNISEKSSYSRK